MHHAAFLNRFAKAFARGREGFLVDGDGRFAATESYTRCRPLTSIHMILVSGDFCFFLLRGAVVIGDQAQAVAAVKFSWGTVYEHLQCMSCFSVSLAIENEYDSLFRVYFPASEKVPPRK